MEKTNHIPILQLNKLIKRFGDVVAVDNVSLNINEGEFLTLLGPSGSGKSTILNMIAGFEFPTGGDIVLQGKSINSLLPEKRNIGLVFQNYALFPHMTVFENIAFPLKMRKVPKDQIGEKVKSALNLVQLEGYEKRLPKQLSGGQQQRIAVARALVFDPPLLLFDEPLGALDKKLREHMQLEIKRIHTRLKRTMIYVTHDQEEALVMSDRIAVMNSGRIEQIGPPDVLYENPINAFVAGFIGESNVFEGIVQGRSNDQVLIHLKGGTEIALSVQGKFAMGEKVKFCIRPEKMFFMDAEKFHQNTINGTIEQSIYVGETKRYTIRIDDQLSLNLREMSNQRAMERHEGEPVRVGWFDDNVKFLA
jgi:spermidine/putrescine ABC transporter ATP-binding subunit